MRTIHQDPQCDAYMKGDRPSPHRCRDEATVPSGLCLFHAGLSRVYIAIGGSETSPSLIGVRRVGRIARTA